MLKLSFLLHLLFEISGHEGYFIICVDPSKLSNPWDSCICTFRALDKLLFSSHLKLVSLDLRATKFFFCRCSFFWRWTSWTPKIPNNSTHARFFRSLASWMVVVLGSHALGKLSSTFKFIRALEYICSRASRLFRRIRSLPNMSSPDSPSFMVKLS